jgi:hypothetical protein
MYLFEMIWPLALITIIRGGGLGMMAKAFFLFLKRFFFVAKFFHREQKKVS